ncbi:MAG: ribosome maturation factor RimM [Proteobacteria bacterium]|nr:ribosome maturation factor RimM [Pseudomonadota bacterium]MDE3208210.1 ribosome maturation factor RimM [Pseudomonadota bacterium]
MGSVRAPFGVRGWVRVQSYMDPPENLMDYPVWSLSSLDGVEEYPVQDSRLHGRWIVAKLEGVEDRDAALALLGRDILIPRERLPKTAENEYYWQDLVGLEVMNCQGIVLGQVDHLLATGANDVLVLRNGRERLIPFIASVVLEVKMDKRQIMVDWDEDF